MKFVRQLVIRWETICTYTKESFDYLRTSSVFKEYMFIMKYVTMKIEGVRMNNEREQEPPIRFPLNRFI